MPAELKTFELRDVFTHIPAVAVRVVADESDADYPWRRAGFGKGTPYVLLTNLLTSASNYDPFRWKCRTMHNAHLHIEKHWADLEDSAVIDVEFLLGLRDTPKTSERHGSLE